MDIERMKKLAGLNEAQDMKRTPLEQSDEGKKSVADTVKGGGEVKAPVKHDVEDFDVVQDDRGNIKVSNEKKIDKKDGEPAKVAQPGKLKLKEELELIEQSRQLGESSVEAAKAKRMAVRGAAEKQANKDGASDKLFTSFAAWKTAVARKGGKVDGDASSAEAFIGDRRIGDWDGEEGDVHGG